MQSKSQRRYLWAKHPKIAREFEDKTPEGAKLPEKVASLTDFYKEAKRERRGLGITGNILGAGVGAPIGGNIVSGITGQPVLGVLGAITGGILGAKALGRIMGGKKVEKTASLSDLYLVKQSAGLWDVAKSAVGGAKTIIGQGGGAKQIGKNLLSHGKGHWGMLSGGQKAGLIAGGAGAVGGAGYLAGRD
jgi:hypothetical protein